MRSVLQTCGLIAVLSLCPTSIKTQWNNYLPCDGQISWAAFPALPPPHDLLFTGSFTLEGWLYLKQADTPALLVSLRTEEGAPIYRLGKETGERFYFELGDGRGKIWRAEAEAPVAAGQWIHVAGVFQKADSGPDGLALYVNARRMATIQQKIALYGRELVLSEGGRMRLAGEPNEPARFGRLDEVRISSTARYTENVIFSITNTFTMDASTVSLWHFDEPFGASLAGDAAGKGLDLALVRDQVPWPVTLEDFSAQRYGGASLLLSWKTSNENDLSGIEVQRRSALESFSCIGFLPAHGARVREFSYDFTDMPKKDGRYYYRLKMINTAGRFRLSPEVGIDFTAGLPTASRAGLPAHLSDAVLR